MVLGNNDTNGSISTIPEYNKKGGKGRMIHPKNNKHPKEPYECNCKGMCTADRCKEVEQENEKNR